LLAPDAKNVLVIGLGCGASAAAVARHPVEHIDVAEISPEVVALQPLFASVNRDILGDPRVRMLTIDGRTHLTYTDRTYDVITSEPSNPWIAGVGNLFSHEFFEACRRHLAPGGVHAQWLQGYGLSRHDVASVIATFRDVYPEATIWEPAWGSDFLLVAKRDGAVTLADLDRAWATASADLATIGIRVPEDLLITFLGGPSLAEGITGGTIVTDDNLHLEFAAARRVREVTGAQYLTERALASGEGSGALRTVLRGDDASAARLERGSARRREAYAAWATDPAHRFEKTLAALEADGVPPEQRLQLSRIMFAGLAFEIQLFRQAQAAFDAEDFATASRLLEQVLIVSPDHAEALETLGESRFMAGNAAAAIEPLSRAVARQPDRWRAYNILGAALATAGRTTDAIAAFERVPRSAGEPYEQAQANLARARALVDGK
jgi:spermidine synthase